MKARPPIRTIKALVLSTAVLGAVASQYVLGNTGGPYYGFPNNACAAPCIGSVTDPIYFSSAVKSYIDASNPERGCIQHTNDG